MSIMINQVQQNAWKSTLAAITRLCSLQPAHTNLEMVAVKLQPLARTDEHIFSQDLVNFRTQLIRDLDKTVTVKGKTIRIANKRELRNLIDASHCIMEYSPKGHLHAHWTAFQFQNNRWLLDQPDPIVDQAQRRWINNCAAANNLTTPTVCRMWKAGSSHKVMSVHDGQILAIDQAQLVPHLSYGLKVAHTHSLVWTAQEAEATKVEYADYSRFFQQSWIVSRASQLRRTLNSIPSGLLIGAKLPIPDDGESVVLYIDFERTVSRSMQRQAQEVSGRVVPPRIAQAVVERILSMLDYGSEQLSEESPASRLLGTDNLWGTAVSDVRISQILEADNACVRLIKEYIKKMIQHGNLGSVYLKNRMSNLEDLLACGNDHDLLSKVNLPTFYELAEQEAQEFQWLSSMIELAEPAPETEEPNEQEDD